MLYAFSTSSAPNVWCKVGVKHGQSVTDDAVNLNNSEQKHFAVIGYDPQSNLAYQMAAPSGIFKDRADALSFTLLLSLSLIYRLRSFIAPVTLLHLLSPDTDTPVLPPVRIPGRSQIAKVLDRLPTHKHTHIHISFSLV